MHCNDVLAGACQKMGEGLARVGGYLTGHVILYDFSGHKPDLEGKIQICFRNGFSRPVRLYKHCNSRSARPDLHMFKV